MAHIKPEHLLEPRDYRQWVKTQNDGSDEDERRHDAAVDDVVFESLSKRAWLDVLLQLIKVSLLLYSFVTMRRYASTVYAVVIYVSVRLFVCLSHASNVSK